VFLNQIAVVTALEVVEDIIFIRLKMRTLSAKNAKKKKDKQ
jgi:hypothetical protein